MKTLEFIKLNESGANNVVASLQQLLADFQVYYTNASSPLLTLSTSFTFATFR